MVYDFVKECVDAALMRAGYGGDDNDKYTVEHPPTEFGDFSTNVAMLIAKRADKSSQEIAKDIVEKLTTTNNEAFESVTIAGPGFINIKLKDSFIISYLQKHAYKKSFGTHRILAGKRVIFEYTDPNPFKELHIGHLMSNAIGESLSRIAEAMGAEVIRVCYQGDVGIHVAKAVWALQKGNLPITKDNLGKAYATGAQAYEEDSATREEIEALNTVINENSEKVDTYTKGKKVSLESFEEMYRRIGTKFDGYIFESVTGPIGKEIVEKGIKDGVFEENEGAIIFPAEKYDKKLHTRVFINARGIPTYEAKEIGCGVVKEKDYHPDESYIVTANEITTYMKVVSLAMTKLGLTIPDYTTHIPHGLLKLTTGKMSSRTGDVITAESLLESLCTAIRKQSKIELVAQDADKIAIAAIRYTILKQNIGRDITFDPEASLSLSGDSGPYLLYTFVRLHSLQGKSKKTLFSFGNKKVYTEQTLIRLLYQYEEVVKKAWETKDSTGIVTYLTQLAGETNSWYAREKVLGTADEREKINLVKMIANTLQSGMHLLGIESIEKM